MLVWRMHYCPPPVLSNNSFKKALKTAAKVSFLFIGGAERWSETAPPSFPRATKTQISGDDGGGGCLLADIPMQR